MTFLPEWNYLEWVGAFILGFLALLAFGAGVAGLITAIAESWTYFINRNIVVECKCMKEDK